MKPYKSLVRPLLFRLDAERAHNAAVLACELCGKSSSARRLAHHAFHFHDPSLRTHVAGIDFANPLGLAAGFDKNGRSVPMLGALGFGHVEIGSVSAFPSSGNPRPRLFRLPHDRAIVVNYGVPNDGADVVSRRLRQHPAAVPIGINLVKTNDPGRPAVEPDVYDDFAHSFAALHGLADYCTLNMSCPNSPGDRDFFDELPRIHRLLEHLGFQSPTVPILLKLKPTADTGVLREIVGIADQFPFVAGFAINLPSGKPDYLRLKAPPTLLQAMPGAVSGRPVEDFVNRVLAELHQLTTPSGRYTLVAAGGVFTAEDAYRKIRLGASLIQLYTGLVYDGPAVTKRILEGLLRLLERDGFNSVGEAVGTGARDA